MRTMQTIYLRLSRARVTLVLQIKRFTRPAPTRQKDGAKHLLVDATTGFYAYFATFLYFVTCALPSAVSFQFHDVQTIFSGPTSRDYYR